MKLKKLLPLACVLLLAGCEAMPFDTTYTSKTSYNQDVAMEASYYDEGQQVTYDGDIQIETKDYNNDSQEIINKIKEVGGKIQSQNSHQNRNYDTNFVGTQLSMVAEIPKDNFHELVESLKENYEIQSFNLSSQDITDNIDDTGESLDVLRQRLSEVEEKLKDESLSFYQEEKLKEEKQSLEDQIKTLEDQQTDQKDSVEYSTLTLNLREVDYYTSEGLPFWLPFVTAFRNIFNYIAYGLVVGITGAIVVIPFLFVGSITYLLIRKFQYKMFRKLKSKFEPEKDGPSADK